jgi:hypothetical protein
MRSKKYSRCGSYRPAATAGRADVHHIVSSTHPRAELSRRLLFGWKIGINDADNGVYLPRDKASELSGMPNAIIHEGLHTKICHLQVQSHLRAAADIDSRKTIMGRNALRAIKDMLIQGIFPYRKERAS